MIKIETVKTSGWKAAIHEIHKQMNSKEKSDSHWEPQFDTLAGPVSGTFVIGSKDFNLMKQLRDIRTDHHNFMQTIIVYMDITAPLYWWKEFDTYKVGTVANSCSTMHKIAEKEFTIDNFSHEHLMAFWDQDIPYSSNETSIYDFKQTLIVQYLI